MGAIKILANGDIPVQERREAEGNLREKMRWQMFLHWEFCWEKKAGFIQGNLISMSPRDF